MLKSDKPKQAVQMYLSEEEEWTRAVPVLDSIPVRDAEQGQVDEYIIGLGKDNPLTMNMMEQIVSLPNLERACRRVILNKGSSGIDGMSVAELGKWFRTNWRNLQRELLTGQYRPQQVKLVEIPKPKGGYRQLGIPTVKDRLVQQAIHQVLNKHYDSTFSQLSYGFRQGRGSREALRQVSHYLSEGRKYIVDIDLQNFFGEVNHDRLMQRLSKRIGDKNLLTLIHQYLKVGILSGGLSSQPRKGTPQGSPLSPLLSNIVLDELDKELTKRGHSYVRYADDIVILVSSLKSGERVKSSITKYLKERLKLKINESKSSIKRPHELNYLGHSFSSTGLLYLSQMSEVRLKDKIRRITQRNRGVRLSQIISELNNALRGWVNYFRQAQMRKRLRVLDSWIRHRLRSYRLKQCKRALGIMRFLHKLGIPKSRAWTTASSRCGWWRKSSTPASQEGMNNKWFDKQGLLNLSDYYKSLQT